MFTSRVEYRLVVREDNADQRLGEMGHAIGLLSDERFAMLQKKKENITALKKVMRASRLKPADPVAEKIDQKILGSIDQCPTWEEFLRRPKVAMSLIEELNPEVKQFTREVIRQVSIETKYAGYIEREAMLMKRLQDLEKVRIPEDFVYTDLSGISGEIQEKLNKIRPVSLGQASHVSGVTPAAMMLLSIHLKKLKG